VTPAGRVSALPASGACAPVSNTVTAAMANRAGRAMCERCCAKF